MTLIDFGIAREDVPGFSTLSDPARTGTGAIIGTPNYMAPEQARGQRDIGPAADIFSLGCVLFQCLVGRPPFSGASAAVVLGQILLLDAPRLRMQRPDLPPETAPLEELLTKMLAREPEKRIPDAAALLLLLEQLPSFSEVAAAAASSAWRSPLGSGPSSSHGEQQLACVILVVPPNIDNGESETLADTQGQMLAQTATAIDTPRIRSAESCRNLLISFGARVAVLADWTLVATFDAGRYGSATDQAVQAARCALALKERWTAAKVVLTSGRALLSEQLPQGEALDRALHLTRMAGLKVFQMSGRSGVVIDEVTTGLLSERFQIVALDQGALLLEERPHFDVNRPLLGQPTPCIGRERELALLEGMLRECAEESVSRAALIIAPPGVGKSRLRHEFLRRIAASSQRCQVFLGLGDPMSKSTPYGLLSQVLHRILPAQNDALRGKHRDPQEQGEEIQQAFLDFLTAECQRQTLLLILEDLHCGDPLTINLIEAALRELSEQPLMVLALARPEVHEQFPALWQGRDLVEVRLPGISRKASGQLIQQVLGERIDPAIRERIIAQAAGNPLFLEEMIRAVAEGKGESLPGTVMAMLQARLGRLEPEARRVLRVASVFGQTFWLGGLTELLAEEQPPDEVERWVLFLCQEELITRHRDSRIAGEVEYGFHHTLVREAAYSLLRDADGVGYHALAGGYLERMGHPEALLIAEHLLRGEEDARAAAWLLRAAEQALDGNELGLCISIAERGVAAAKEGEVLGRLRALQSTAAYWQSDYPGCLRYAEAALSHLRPGTVPWFHIQGNAIVACSRLARKEDWRALLARCEQVEAEALAESEQIICLARVGIQLYLNGEQERADALLEKLKALYSRVQVHEPLARAQYHHLLSVPLLEAGDMLTHAECFAIVVKSFEEAGALRNAATERCMLAVSLEYLGQHEEAEAMLRRNLLECQRLKSTQALMFTKVSLARVLAFRRSATKEIRGFLEEAIAYYTSASHMRWLAISNLTYARLEFAAGNYQAALTRTLLASEQMPRNSLHYAMVQATLARSLVAVQQPEEALPLGRAALHGARQRGGFLMDDLEPPIALTEVLLALNKTDEARQVITETQKYIRRRCDALTGEQRKEAYLAVPDRVYVSKLARELV